MKNTIVFLAVLSAAAVLSSCSDDTETPVCPPGLEDTDGGFVEPVPEKTVYTGCALVYTGDDTGTGISDLWTMTLYTDMEISGNGDPVGPGKILSISMNAAAGEGVEPDLSYLEGTYREASSTGDYSPGTFNWGFMYTIDLPTGAIERPANSFYGDIPSGTTSFEPDLIREGYCNITGNGDGTYTVTGELVGTMFMKRYFSYTGELEIIDRSEQPVPNTTLTHDITLSGLTESRIRDNGDTFGLGDESCRTFELFLAEPTVDLSKSWPGGPGELLRLEFFVEWEADVKDGIPAGVYEVAPLTAGGGIYRDDIIPFRLVPGYPDKFTYNSGSWYQVMDGDNAWTGYARISGGQVTVERNGDGHKIIVSLTDCAEKPNKIEYVWESVSSIPVFR